MERRKIQLIAGATYTVSLPKKWIKKNHLMKNNEILIYEKHDGSICISPSFEKEKELKDITIDADHYANCIDQVLFSVYYLGAEKITLNSNKGLTKEMKLSIRKVFAKMSGSEISHEDEQKITIQILLDKSKVDIMQLLYRIGKLTEFSIENIYEKPDMKEIRINEDEINRLYHLIVKIIYLSLTDSNILNSSNIKNSLFIPSYSLIGKKMENIGDNIKRLGLYLVNKKNFENKKEILNFIKKEIERNSRHIIKNFPAVYEKVSEIDRKKIRGYIQNIKDKTISDFLMEILRYTIDIEEEIIKISFYNKLLHDKKI
jgi:phosphate uptake regulator